MHPCHVSQSRTNFSMSQKTLIKIWKTAPLIFTFSFSLLLFVCFFCVKEMLSALPMFASYIEAGKSVFLPFIPRINLFCFLPEEAQVLPFTIGHLIDFVIIVNLSMVVNPIALPFYKKVRREYQQNQFFDLHIGYVRPRQRPTWVFFDVNPTILLNNQCVLDDSKGPGFGCVSDMSETRRQRMISSKAKDSHAVGFITRFQSRPLRSPKSLGLEPITTRISPACSKSAGIPARDLTVTRYRVSHNIFASVFTSTSSISVRHRPPMEYASTSSFRGTQNGSWLNPSKSSRGPFVSDISSQRVFWRTERRQKSVKNARKCRNN